MPASTSSSIGRSVCRLLSMENGAPFVVAMIGCAGLRHSLGPRRAEPEAERRIRVLLLEAPPERCSAASRG